ncbi:hypothetical protein B0J15DRAFT_473205 [Fusarium solani]|uniref:Uncharacterized protein n=1 Tax=Fusarium solani TaxID=169388 RepID=A0A9P9G0Y5_FUSSL|nr:uncharacterized protein B0J15DRAFT_473205 [Fusarium solani]KAH7229952.1 hypothetical protein B0J15DRAFT_473205 [Fusarium solani]
MAEKAPNSRSPVATRENRKVAREQCREALADHINERTGLEIQPSQVRLYRTEKSGYSWKVHSDPIRALFSRGLSSIGIAALQKLRCEVGDSFEAVPSRTGGTPHEPEIIPRPAPNQSHNSASRGGETDYVRFQGVDYHNHSFSQQLAREEAESRRLGIELQNTNAQLEFALQQLQECTAQLQGTVKMKEYYESFLLKIFLAMNDIGPVVEGLREESCRALSGHSDTEQAPNTFQYENR